MLPSILVPVANFQNIDQVLRHLAGVEEVEAGIASVGDAAAYALVWEWGNLRQTREGPRTIQGTNPDGSEVWLSSQAPFGYIRVNEARYWGIVQEVLANVNMDQTNSRAMSQELKRAAREIIKRMVAVTQETVPVDRGDLHDSLRPVNPGDALLSEEGDDYEILTLSEE